MRTDESEPRGSNRANHIEHQLRRTVRWWRLLAVGVGIFCAAASAHALTPTSTATPVVPVGCVGDCGDDGEVAIDDILLMVNIALSNAAVSACPRGNPNADDAITIDEILTAVSNAQNGCSTSGTPTPTPTTGSAAGSVALGSIIMANVMSAVPSVVTAFATGVQIGGPTPGAGSGAATADCPLGGTATSNSMPPVVLSIILSQCKVATSTGAVTFNGTVSSVLESFNADLEARFESTAGGGPTLIATTVINGTLSFTPGGGCTLTAVTLNVLNSRLAAKIPGGPEVAAVFPNTMVVADEMLFNLACVPLSYRVTFNGPATLNAPEREPTNVMLSDLQLRVDDRNNPTLFALDGGMDSSCFGGLVTVVTEDLLSVASGQVCPAAGSLAVISATDQGRVFYRADQSIDIDANGNGTLDPGELHVENCLDPQLSTCVTPENLGTDE